MLIMLSISPVIKLANSDKKANSDMKAISVVEHYKGEETYHRQLQLLVTFNFWLVKVYI